jgi:transcriptional regulator with XRE-family HTH domain
MPKKKSPFGEIKSPNGDRQVKLLIFAEFGARLRKAAQERGLNQKTLAHNLGVPTSTIGRYWHGQRLLPLDLLFDAADCLAVDPRWLATGESLNGSSLSADEHELLLRYRSLQDAQRKHLLQNAGLLAGTMPAFPEEKESAPASLHSPKQDYRVKPPQ